MSDSGSSSVFPTSASEDIDWKVAYLQKDQELKFVAELGKQLVEKLSHAEQKIKDLEQENQRQSADIQRLKKTTSETGKQKDAIHTEKERIYELEDKIQKTEGTTKQYQAKISAITETNKEWSKKIEDYKEKLDKSHQNELHLRNQLQKLEKEITYLNDNIKKEVNKAVIEAIKSAQESFNQELKFKNQQIESWENEYNKATRKIQDLYKNIDDLEITKKEYKELYESVQNEKEEIKKEKEQMIVKEMIEKEETRQENEKQKDQIENLIRRVEDLQIEINSIPSERKAKRINKFGSVKKSILYELQAELENRIGVNDEYNNNNNNNNSLSLSSLPNVSDYIVKEEYFYLTAAAVKVNLALKLDTDLSFKVNVSELFKDAVLQSVQFHEWYPWIKKNIKRKMQEMSLPKNDGNNNNAIVKSSPTSPNVNSNPPTSSTSESATKSKSKKTDAKSKSLFSKNKKSPVSSPVISPVPLSKNRSRPTTLSVLAATMTLNPSLVNTPPHSPNENINPLPSTTTTTETTINATTPTTSNTATVTSSTTSTTSSKSSKK